METSQIKKFAQSLRNQLRDGVKQRLLYWGFNEKGEVNERPEAVEGGYMFRGEVFSDETVPNRWKQLKRMVDLHSIDYVIEEGAYTWFNRLMAIRILEKNDYIQPQLQYEEGTQLPHLLQNARRGIFPDMKDNELKQVKKQLRENRDNEAFARLLTHFCDTQPLISKVFGKISYSNDYTELLLPQNLLDQQGILDFIVTTNAITDEDFEQVELIGWLYQYYISEKKDEVFKSFKKRKKAGPEELPAATQIFTPEWIVRYMVENTVGRLWLDLHPDSSLREKFEYFVEPAKENPKAEPIIENVTDLTLLDPAAGSGHILIVGFEYMMAMYREEGYTARQAIEGILENNLYGLEIDERAAQLARFAVLLKAAKYDQSVLDGDKLPHIHSFPEQTNISTAEIREFLGSEGEPYVDEFKDVLSILQEGKNFGSTTQLEISEEGVAFAQKRAEALQPEAVANLAVKQLLLKIEPFIYVIDLLSKRYTAVAANPPFMGSGNMNGKLKQFLKDNYPDSKKDLATAFMEVFPKLSKKYGLYSFITPPSWLCLSSYEKLRQKYITNYHFESLLHLSRGIFGADFGSATCIIRNDSVDYGKGEYFGLVERTFQEFNSSDLRDLFLEAKNNPAFRFKFKGYSKGVDIKSLADRNGKKIHFSNIGQAKFLQIPGSPIAYWVSNTIINHFKHEKRIEDFADTRLGMATANNSLFVRYWFEVSQKTLKTDESNRQNTIDGNGEKWFPYSKGGSAKKWYGNKEHVVNWENDGQEIRNFTNDKGKVRSHNYNLEYIFKKGITWNALSSTHATFRVLEYSLFDNAGSSLFTSSDRYNRILGFLNTKLVKVFLSSINPTFNFQPGNIAVIPYKEEGNLQERIVEDLISIAKKDWNSREVSWDFSNPPLIDLDKHSIEDAINTWKEKKSHLFLKVHKKEEKLNRFFIDLYDLQDELNPKVSFEDITILQDELNHKKLNQIETKYREDNSNSIQLDFKEDVLINQVLSYALGCMMGRYKLQGSGLHIAYNNPDPTELESYQIISKNNEEHIFIIDDDGLIPLIGSDGPFSDDVVYRMKNFIRIIWGERSLTENLNYIQKKLGNNLEKFLTDKLWSYHKKLYSKRPIYWLFSSKNGAFKVLAYMHRMDKYTVQKVRQNYLHPYMDYLRNEIDKLEGRDSLNSDESKQLDTYRSNLNECLEYDEVIKEVADKQIDFDLDDGVKHNYELFGKALAKI